MARLLIVGGGRRGLELARAAVREDGHAVRVVTRRPEARERIEAAGAECWRGDPDRLGTLRGALEGVTIACWLLARASGPAEQVRALHDDRLRAFLGQTIDTTVRGFVYEGAADAGAAGVATGAAVPAEVLAAGEGIVRELAERNAIPLAVLRADPGAPVRWLARARAAVSSLLE